MPITYEVKQNGHFIHAVARSPLTGDEFVDYEVGHAIDERIKSPVSELFEIRMGAWDMITKDDILEVVRRRGEVEDPPTPHRCAIVLSYFDNRGWDMAEFYEGMVKLHSPETVIIFGDMHTAGVWLGVEDLRMPEN